MPKRNIMLLLSEKAEVSQLVKVRCIAEVVKMMGRANLIMNRKEKINLC